MVLEFRGGRLEGKCEMLEDREIVLEVGRGRFGGFKPHTSSLAPQTIPLPPPTSFL
jgi:hypothetical protein